MLTVTETWFDVTYLTFFGGDIVPRAHTSYERIINWELFFCKAPQAALLRFDEVSKNQLFGKRLNSGSIVRNWMTSCSHLTLLQAMQNSYGTIKSKRKKPSRKFLAVITSESLYMRHCPTETMEYTKLSVFPPVWRNNFSGPWMKKKTWACNRI